MALTTEHFTLQTARSATIADNNGRSALYLTTVSSAVVALAFIGQLTPPETPMVLSGGANASVPLEKLNYSVIVVSDALIYICR